MIADYITNTNVRIFLCVIGLLLLYFLYKYTTWAWNYFTNNKNPGTYYTSQMYFSFFIIILSLTVIPLFIAYDYQNSYTVTIKGWIS
jgi:hypothetical protein